MSPAPARPRRRAARAAALALLAGLALLASPAAAVDPSPAPAPGAAARAPLTVIVTGVAEARGELLVTVFSSADGWRRPERAVASARAPARAPETEVRLEGVPVGACAVAVVHDLNGNGKLDMRWFPYPHPGEPAGASNDAPARLGPPSFEDARLELPAGGRTIRIALR